MPLLMRQKYGQNSIYINVIDIQYRQCHIGVAPIYGCGGAPGGGGGIMGTPGIPIPGAEAKPGGGGGTNPGLGGYIGTPWGGGGIFMGTEPGGIPPICIGIV